MDFTFNEEQTLIQDQVDQFIQKEYDWETRQSLSNSDLGFGNDNWQKFAELGWLGISTSEESGGFGGSAIESMLIMEAFGKGLVVEPFLETIIMCGGLLDEHGTDQQKSSILESAIAGQMHLAMAYAEPQSRFNLSDVVTEAKADGDSFLINGYKSVVMNGPSANKFIVSARTSGPQLDENGITLFLVEGDAEGLNKTNYKTVDGRLQIETGETTTGYPHTHYDTHLYLNWYWYGTCKGNSGTYRLYPLSTKTYDEIVEYFGGLNRSYKYLHCFMSKK